MGVEIILQRDGNERPLGRASADMNERATFLTSSMLSLFCGLHFLNYLRIKFLGQHDDIMITASLNVMENLQFGDRIYVKMDVEGSGGSSKIMSSSKPSIHFIGQKIGDSPAER